MTVLMVPNDGKTLWPTLGPQVCEWIERNLVHGPGDLRGEPARLDDEKRALIYRAYELFPPGHAEAGRRRFKRVGLSLAKGLAKALALETVLPTPTGWTTIGEVVVGDKLLGMDGRPISVIAKSAVFFSRPCFLVRFRDGSELIADADHRWFTQTRRPEGQGVVTTAEIRNSLYWHPTKPYANHRIPVAAPFELPEADLPIPPYTLGVWLGDGRNSNSMITKGSHDLSQIEHHVNEEGIETSRYEYEDRAPNLWLKGLNPKLRDFALLHQKHIPSVYLRASIPQRLALLQGLMDTDGTVSLGRNGNGRCTFGSKDKPLAEGVLELTRTLGIRPTWGVKRAKFNGRDYGEYYEVGFTPRDDVAAFRLERKLKKSKRTARKTSQALSRTIIAIEQVPSVPVQCIAVDSVDHLYLAGEGMIPTHNTELAAWIAAAELHPSAPVRCVGFDRRGSPLGGPVSDPYVPLVAYTEEQSDELCYGALKAILEESAVREDFDIGLERIMRKDGDGKAVSLSAAPSSRDGARTTFSVFDETHWWTLPRLKKAHQTMLANLPKRKIADPWALEITTAPEPGMGSVAESTMDYARAVSEGRAQDARLFYFHREASEGHDLATEDGARAAVIEASGEAAKWRDIDAIVALWADPTTDRNYWERVWCNRLVRTSGQAFDAELFKSLAGESPVKDGDLITLGFDGAVFHDSTALVATHVETGYQWLAGVWEAPHGLPEWHVPEQEVDDCVDAMFQRYEVWRLYADPPYWQSWVAHWSGKYGEDRVIEWWTNRRRQMTHALENYDTAMKQGSLSHDGSAVLVRHIANSCRHDLPQLDDEGRHQWLIRKERSDSPRKIDAAMAAVLSWEARTDAIAKGEVNTVEWSVV